MIRAFAPGMTMQEQLPQVASPSDVRQEPTAPESDAPAAEPHDPSEELMRVEELLLLRTRERRELAQELERRSALLRDACAQLTELAPQVAEAARSGQASRALQEERDAAVARAVEAEVARAEATFKLDEVLGRLLAAGGRPGEVATASASERVLSARLAELDEQKQMADARLLLLEDELAQEKQHLAIAARDRVETQERFEFELGQARVWADTAQHKLAELTDARGALLGERDGLRSRLEEAERALRAAVERLALALHQGTELKDKLEVERAERAKHVARADAVALQLDELTRARAQDHDRLRELHAELERERSAGADAANTLTAQQIRLEQLKGDLERANQSSGGDRDEAFAALQSELETERGLRAETANVVAGHESALETLRAELEIARSQTTNNGTTLAARDATIANLREALDQEREQRGQSLESLEERDAKLAELRAELERERARASDAANMSAANEATLASLQSDFEGLRAQRADATSTLATREGALADTQAELERERARANDAANTVTAREAALADAQAQLDGERARANDAANNSAASDAALASLRSELDAARSQHAQATNTLSAREAALGDMQAELEHERARANDTANTLVTHDETLATLRAELEEARSQRAEATSTLSARSDALADAQAELEHERARADEAANTLAAREGALADLQAELLRERMQSAEHAAALAARDTSAGELHAELDRERTHANESAHAANEREAALEQVRAELETERAQNVEAATTLAAHEAALADLRAALERARSGEASEHEAAVSQLQAALESERSHNAELANRLAEHEAALADVQTALERERTEGSDGASGRTAAHEIAELQGELERERSARSWLAGQLAAAEAGRTSAPAGDLNRRIEASQQQERLEALRASLLELRHPLVEFGTAVGRIAQGKPAPARTQQESSDAPTMPGFMIDPEAFTALDEQLRQKDSRIEELEAALATERQARVSLTPAEREARAVARDTSVATLKGELIDVRTSATRLSDDLAKERTRRRKMAVTVRALQAATESGEAPGPWIEELITLVNEGTSMPPKV